MYNKLFTKILDSSIWLEPVTTRVVWITLIAAMDEDGYAHFSAIENLAARARVSVEEAKAAVECFLNPDPNSSNPANEGRRVERVPGGFMILNAPYHRKLISRVVEKEQNRIRVQRHRDKKKDTTHSEAEAGVMESNGDVMVCNGDVMVGSLPKSASPSLSDETKARLEQSKRILGIMNSLSCKKFRFIEANSIPICARLEEEGVNEEGIVKMLQREWERRKNDPEGIEWFKPQTIFRAKNFDGYYSAKDLPVPTKATDGNSKDPQWKQEQRLEETIAGHPGNREFIGYNADTVTERQKEECRALRQQLAKLRGVQ